MVSEWGFPCDSALPLKLHLWFLFSNPLPSFFFGLVCFSFGATITKSGVVPETAKAIDSRRTIIVLPDIEAKFDGINMLDWSKLV